MGKPEMQKNPSKKPKQEDKISTEETERSMESATEKLETENPEETVLLMKCPPSVANAWREPSDSSSESVPLAKYIESFDPLHLDQPPELHMEMVSDKIPKLYSAKKGIDSRGPMIIFSEANQGEVAMEGTVTHKLNIRPDCDIEEYGKHFRERNVKPVAEIKDLERWRALESMPKPKMVTEKPKPCVKRTRSDRSEVEAKMFKLFERQPKWRLKQLIQETNQPEEFLKEILKELCVYNKSGQNYELKPAYKKTG